MTKCRNKDFNTNKKNFEKLEQVMHMFPSMRELTNAGDLHGIKGILDQKDDSAYLLLQWIITSNRSYLVKIDQQVAMSNVGTKYQFLMLTQNPEREVAFQKHKEKHGSTYAFHGSPAGNWHSILRRGLINASGTKLQANGAAYGKGIYLAQDSSTSSGYCGYYNHNHRDSNSSAKDVKKDGGDGRAGFIPTDQINCLAICEVINSPDIKKSGNIWVASNEEHICTRFLLVYPSGVNIPSMSATSLVPEIQKALSFYQF